MNLSNLLPDLNDVPESFIDEAIFDSFLDWIKSQEITLYPAQEEASLGILAGDNVILATPTGSGKSMVAIAAHFIALAKGQRSYYTAPIKALVSEKFFALCSVFGPENVGMMTGDATVNGNAPIICATAEIVANIALRDGADAAIDQVVMDEFHYYSDPERGWAWQVPLLELPATQFLLMSATLGDTTFLQEDLSRRTGRTTSLVGAHALRPVPLEFHYVYTPVTETIENLLEENKAPIYIVHFTQREAIERAQGLKSLHKIITEEEKRAIAKEIGDFRFTTTFGRTLSLLLRRGIGIHHAGMLPKYRRLVEKLSQTGLLKIICGTDTLGVGINVPIRTVLFTGLAKFDGNKQRILNSREFHQIAGRAGRAGFDTVGHVYIQATEHEIENAALRKRAGQDPKKLKKLRLKSAREGQISWTEKTFDRLIDAQSEGMKSQFRVSNSMLINMITRPRDTYEELKKLIRGNHDSREKQNRDILTLLEFLRSLLAAGIVVRYEEPDIYGRSYALTIDLQRDFALNQPLAPFALAALELLDPDSDTYTLDIISVFEAIVEDPRQILLAQQRHARNEALANLKAEGVDYTERMNIIEEITWPQPLEELLDTAYTAYITGQPWARDFELSPKSVVRDMLEHGMTFSDLIATYNVARSEGVALRYLTDIWRTLEHSVPPEYRTAELEDIIIWLGELIRQVDSSLVDEWAQLSDPDAPISEETLAQELAFGVSDPNALSANQRALTVMVRNLMFRVVELFAFEQEETLETMFNYLDQTPDFTAALDAYFDEYSDLDTSSRARGPEYFSINKDDKRHWKVRQILKDPEDDNAFAFHAIVDLDATDAAGEIRLASLSITY
ncbi:helicase family protein [Corynebacterium kutscheri]|uniref:Helicase family protein n=1 Tax=Corynebacterium kutscheri TaxID=35755 RepID=A0A0F6TDM1_9CORY|nr:DEAD/DEAH box helicase [Corynebacterium kutscheri]AKE41384.1 helicase family protein [Corynebacterium kutscheri]VEH09708.1 helicase [Corynebacterium kutscheri]